MKTPHYLIAFALVASGCTAAEEPIRGPVDGTSQTAAPAEPPKAEAPSEIVEEAAAEPTPDEVPPAPEAEPESMAEAPVEEAPPIEEAPVEVTSWDKLDYTGPEPLKWVDLSAAAMVVRTEPSNKADKIGSVRRGHSFPVFEFKEGRGCKADWARIGPGWVCSDRFVDAAGPPKPVEPLPFDYATVFKDTEIHTGPHTYMGTGKIRKARSTVTVLEKQKRWARTWPDQWIDARILVPREKRNYRLKGEVITEETELPFAFIRRNHVKGYPKPNMSKVERRRAKDEVVPVNRFSRHKVVGQWPEKARFGPQYIQLEDVGWIAHHQIGVVKQRERPKGIGEDEKWALIDLSEQTIVAYEGDKMVYATVVSTGKGKPTPEEFTPTGKFKIRTKLRSSRMAGGSGASYHFLSDVPWVQYFHGGYALHGVYWHNGFGWPMSQGCVNLTPYDAQWFFSWTGPELPVGWYSYDYRDGGTWIVVQK